MKKIIITGANGFLGRKLIKKLVDEEKCSVVAVASSEEKLLQSLAQEQVDNIKSVDFISNDDFLSEKSLKYKGDIYCLVHLAFSRRFRPPQEIASSIDYAYAVFNTANKLLIEKVVNISSQGIYGDYESFRTEDVPAQPKTSYTMAKYATELVFKACMSKSQVRNYSNLRLDCIAQTQKILISFCDQVSKGFLHLVGGQQKFSFLDVNDAISAIVTMIFNENKWEFAYNVGINCQRYSLLDIADLFKEVVLKKYNKELKIEFDRQDINLYAGLDSTRFTKLTSWTPKYTLKDSIQSMLEEKYGK